MRLVCQAIQWFASNSKNQLKSKKNRPKQALSSYFLTENKNVTNLVREILIDFEPKV